MPVDFYFHPIGIFLRKAVIINCGTTRVRKIHLKARYHTKYFDNFYCTRRVNHLTINDRDGCRRIQYPLFKVAGTGYKGYVTKHIIFRQPFTFSNCHPRWEIHRNKYTCQHPNFKTKTINNSSNHAVNLSLKTLCSATL